MSDEKKYIIIRIVILLFISILIILFFTLKKKPEEIIEKCFDITLPASYEIINFENNVLSGDFKAKILIKEKDIEKINNDFTNFFGQEENPNDINLPDLGGLAKWWDANKGRMLSVHMDIIEQDTHSMVSFTKTTQTWILLVQQNDGKYYLFISRS